MKTHRIAHLIPCRKTRFVNTFFPEMESSAQVYIAEVPALMDLEQTAAVILRETDVEGLLSYEITEYFQEINELILSAFENKLIPLIVGSDTLLALAIEQISSEVLVSSPYSVRLFNKQNQKREEFRNYFFTFEEGVPCYYKLETLVMYN